EFPIVVQTHAETELRSIHGRGGNGHDASASTSGDAGERGARAPRIASAAPPTTIVAPTVCCNVGTSPSINAMAMPPTVSPGETSATIAGERSRAADCTAV